MSTFAHAEDFENPRGDPVIKLKHRLMNFVRKLNEEGLLGGHFHHIRQLQDADNPTFVGDVLSLYISDSQRLMRLLVHLLDLDTIDYNKISIYAQEFQGSSSNIGAQKVSLSCSHMYTCSRKELNRLQCRMALKQIISEFDRVKPKLERLVMMEREILEYAVERSFLATTVR